MFVGLSPETDFTLFQLRRNELVDAVKERYPDVKEGVIVLCAGLEEERSAFWQESSFFYFTGLHEPGVILTLDFSGKSTLFVPATKGNRAQWVYSQAPLTEDNKVILKLDSLSTLGEPISGYQMSPLIDAKHYSNVLSDLKKVIDVNGTVFTLVPNKPGECVQQKVLMSQLDRVMPGLEDSLVDISPLVARMRQKKDMHEINQISRAVDITILAQEAASQAIAPGVTECEVQAGLEYMITGSCARMAFPSIVATGSNATILHYTINKDTLQEGQLAVVDIGAAFENYCADLTRTYPVSGRFTARQKELYNLVLETQEYVERMAKPGMYLVNKDNPEKSLHHLAKKYLDERGYGAYFTHGIGHYLGLDVHDVGDYSEPLSEGDVFTIEPGLYIPQENIGIRIEDDYWMSKDGLVCLSELLPRKAEDIEAMVQESFDTEIEIDYEDDADSELAES